MTHFSLSALGSDRPGIVAAVTGVLVDLGCNLEDSTMTILRGHFAILLVVAAPERMSAEVLERALDPVSTRFELTIAVRPLADSPLGVEVGAQRESDVAESAAGMGEGAAGDAWTIVVHGADRPGIVHAVTSALSEMQGNVVDLATHVVGEPAAPVYVMTMRATLPRGQAGEAAVRHVSEAADALGVRCTIHRDESDLL